MNLSTSNKVTIAVITLLVALPFAWAAGGAGIWGYYNGSPVELQATSSGILKTSSDPAALTSSVYAETAVLSVAADGGVSTGTLVPASPLSGRRSIEICNNGPNTITCHADGTTVVAGKGREIYADSCWSLDCNDTACPVRCIASTADQATGNATVSTEIK